MNTQQWIHNKTQPKPIKTQTKHNHTHIGPNPQSAEGGGAKHTPKLNQNTVTHKIQNTLIHKHGRVSWHSDHRLHPDAPKSWKTNLYLSLFDICLSINQVALGFPQPRWRQALWQGDAKSTAIWQKQLCNVATYSSPSAAFLFFFVSPPLAQTDSGSSGS